MSYCDDCIHNKVCGEKNTYDKDREGILYCPDKRIEVPASELLHGDPFCGSEVELFDRVEKALGFKLFFWQKTFITTGYFRRYGETTARILRLALDPSYTQHFERPENLKARIYRQDFMKIWHQLKAADIPVCKIKINGKDYKGDKDEL